MSNSKYSILPYHKRIWRRWLIEACVMAGVFIFGVVAGQIIFGSLAWDAWIDRSEIRDQLSDAESMNGQLKRQIAVYENASHVDQLAVKNTQEDLKELQAKLIGMEKELEFYRRIVSPEHRNYELQIQSFRMFQGPQGQQFALTLSQGIGRNTTIQATAQIQFTGLLNGEEKTLNLGEVDSEHRKNLAFSFRYFQTLTATVNYPEGFELETITVSAEPHTKRREKVSKTWPIKDLQIESAVSGSTMGEIENPN